MSASDRETLRIDDRAVEALVEAALPEAADVRTGPLLEGLIEDVMGLVADGTEVADLKLVAAAFSEIRQALRCFRPYPERRKVTAFGSARIPSGTPTYELAERFGRKMAEAGYMLITGGGPGIMEAVLRGAGRDNAFGVGIRLPFEQQANAVIDGDPKLIEFKYFFTRKLFFVKEASAIVLFPGGFGTHDEGFEALTLVQTGKTRTIPIVCLDVPDGTYWRAWDLYVRDHLLRRGLISEQDLSLYTITHDVDEAVAEIVRFYRVYHSSRFIRGRLVLRLNHDVDDEVLETLSSEFTDLLGGRPVRRAEALREEADEPELAALPRLTLSYDHYSYGRLRRLIDRLNDLGSEPAGS